jgi:chaperone modulatory protein CbpM
MSRNDREPAGTAEVLHAQLLDDSVWVEVDEFCTRLRIERQWIVELVELGALEPREAEVPERWAFALSDVPRVRTMARLVRDLGVNLSGAALIVELLEERRQLLAQLGRGWRG